MIFPKMRRSSKSRCASGACASGSTRSTTGRSLPASTCRKMASRWARLPMVEPRMERFLKKTWRRFKETSAPVVAPQVTSLPPQVRQRRLCSNVALPTCSMTTSAPRFPVRRLTSPLRFERDRSMPS